VQHTPISPQADIYVDAAIELLCFGEYDSAKDILVHGIGACACEPDACEQIHDLIAVVDLGKRLNGKSAIIGGVKVTLEIQPLYPQPSTRLVQ
jgi:hypothetical protein